MRLDVLLGKHRIGLADDHGMHGFAPRGVRNADHGASRHRGMPRDHVLDLGRIHVLAAADDHVLEAVDDDRGSRLVHVGAIAGVEPAAAQRLCGFLRLVPVADHDVRAAHDDLAHVAARHFLAVPVDDFHHESRQAARPADGTGRSSRPASPWFAAGLAEMLGPGFGHAVGMREARHQAALRRPAEQPLRRSATRRRRGASGSSGRWRRSPDGRARLDHRRAPAAFR